MPNSDGEKKNKQDPCNVTLIMCLLHAWESMHMVGHIGYSIPCFPVGHSRIISHFPQLFQQHGLISVGHMQSFFRVQQDVLQRYTPASYLDISCQQLVSYTARKQSPVSPPTGWMPCLSACSYKNPEGQLQDVTSIIIHLFWSNMR